MATVTSPVAARPPVLPSQTTRVPTALGAAFVTLACDQQGQPFELFRDGSLICDINKRYLWLR